MKQFEKVGVDGGLPQKSWRTLTLEDFKNILHDKVSGILPERVMRKEKEFMVGSLSLCADFWEREILADHPKKQLLMSWIKGVKIETFFKPFTREEYKGIKIEAKIPPPVQFSNYVPQEFFPWVSETVQEYKRIKMLVPWNQVRREEESIRPQLILPLGIEPNKPRLLWDARYLNLFLKQCPFTLEGVDKISTIGWENMYLFKIDHKAGYLHVPFHRESWTYLGVEWDNEVLVFTCLAFGGSNCPVIYHSLTDATTMYIRKLDIPGLDYIDDMLFGTPTCHKHKSPEEQLNSTKRACYVTTLILFCAGYFLNKKCIFEPVTRIVYLGIECDTKNQMFWVPEEKIRKLIALVEEILKKGISNFAQLEKVVGKCRSMSVAVPAAALYTREQYRTLKNEERPHKRGEGKEIIISKELREELEMWVQLSTKLNGAKWKKPGNIRIAMQGFSDSSSRRTAGIFFSSTQQRFICAEDLHEEHLTRHINEQEGVALKNSVEAICLKFPSEIEGKKVLCRVDSKVLFDIYNKQGSSSNRFITNICKTLFWLQIDFSFELKLELVDSENNLADSFTREDTLNDLRLTNKYYFKIWDAFGPFTYDIMASSSNVKCNTVGEKLKFFSRYFSKGCEGVDVFTQNLGNLEGLYCFPPICMIAPVLSLLKSQKASAVVVVPDIRDVWWSTLKEEKVSSLTITQPEQGDAFMSTKRNGNRMFEKFKHKFLAVKLNFMS